MSTPSNLVANIMLPFVLSLPVMKAFWPSNYAPHAVQLESAALERVVHTLPAARSTKVSSERIRVTFGFDFAAPL